MKFGKKCLLILAGLLMLIPFSTSFSASKVKIGFLVKMPEESWFQKEWVFAEQAAKDYGFELVKIGTTDGEKVLTAIDNLGAQGAQGFVICTPDVKLGPAIVTKAKANNLKVIAVDDRFIGANGKPMEDVVYLGISARKIGENVGQAIWDEYQRRGWKESETGAIAISFKELETARDRVEGAISTLTKNGFPKRKIYDAPQKTTDVEGGFNAANIVITKNPKIKHWFIFALNDETVTGGVRATEGRGFGPEDVIGVGINGMAAAVTEFQKPEATGFYGSFLLQAKVHGYETSKMMYEWISTGKQPPLDTRTTGTLITRDTYKNILTENGLADLIK
jgi:L-arabinose transport system substrate-binding protein